MHKGDFSDSSEVFSYQNQRFSSQKFIISTRDNRYEYNVIPIIVFDNGNLVDLDEWEFDNNVFATRPPYTNPHNIEDLPLTRFYKNQLVKIDYGTIVSNTGAENPNMPKLKTFNANIHSFETNQVIEFFEGRLNEGDSLFTPSSDVVFELLKDVYVETENCFFTIVDNKLIGPFIALKVNQDSFEVLKSTWRTFGEYELNDQSFIQFEANDLTRKVYVPDCNLLSLDFKKDFDFTSDDDLLKQFDVELKKYPEYFEESSLENIKKIITKSSELKSLEKIIKSNNRLEKLLERSQKVLIKNIDLINFFPEVKRIKEDKQKLEQEFFDIKKELEKQEVDLSRKINELTEQKETLKIDITNLEQTKTEELEKRKTELDLEIESLQSRKSNLENEVNEKYLELSENLAQTKSDIEYYERTKAELKKTIEDLREDFKEEQKQSQITLQNLVKSKIHFDFISGRDLGEQETKADNFIKYEVQDQYRRNQYREFRNDLVNILRQNNRNFETHFIDNLLISIFQNTLTIFAGVPGTGKTTLARIITKILVPKGKIREISVNRGWSSQKDFIGFVNPLTRKFHSSSTDLYSLLKQMNYESSNPELYLNSPVSFVILDEANLSPLEHYWSSFYNLTDSYGMLEIKLGHDEIIKFPNNLRFIGTINYDHTTEELSPRVLDRVNIIQLDKLNDLIINKLSNTEISNFKLSFQRCIDFFELTDFNDVDIAIDEKIEKGYKEIRNEFTNLKIIISTRVEMAIKRYINLASKYMSDVNKPLDYCVAQRLLPLINLQGADNKQKLESLKEKLKENKCEISVKILDEIIGIGSEKGIHEDNFNYFMTLSNV